MWRIVVYPPQRRAAVRANVGVARADQMAIGARHGLSVRQKVVLPNAKALVRSRLAEYARRLGRRRSSGG